MNKKINHKKLKTHWIILIFLTLAIISFFTIRNIEKTVFLRSFPFFEKINSSESELIKWGDKIIIVCERILFKEYFIYDSKKRNNLKRLKPRKNSKFIDLLIYKNSFYSLCYEKKNNIYFISKFNYLNNEWEDIHQIREKSIDKWAHLGKNTNSLYILSNGKLVEISMGIEKTYKLNDLINMDKILLFYVDINSSYANSFFINDKYIFLGYTGFEGEGGIIIVPIENKQFQEAFSFKDCENGLISPEILGINPKNIWFRDSLNHLSLAYDLLGFYNINDKKYLKDEKRNYVIDLLENKSIDDYYYSDPEIPFDLSNEIPYFLTEDFQINKFNGNRFVSFLDLIDYIPKRWIKRGKPVDILYFPQKEELFVLTKFNGLLMISLEDKKYFQFHL